MSTIIEARSRLMHGSCTIEHCSHSVNTEIESFKAVLIYLFNFIYSYILLYYIVLHYIALYYVILYYIVLYCTVLYCTMLYYYIILYCIVLYCIVLYYISFYVDSVEFV